MDFSGVRRRLAAAVGEVRRTILVRRRLLSAVCAGVAVLALVRALAPPPVPTSTVLVAARELGAGEVVGAADVRHRRLPVAAVPERAVRDPVGHTLAGPVAPGEVITDARVVGPSLLEGHAGSVAMPVRIADAAVVDLLRVGDRVELYAADPASATPAGRRLLEDGLVLALPLPSGHGAGGAEGRLVVLAVSPDQGALISGHAARGLLTVALAR